MTPEQQAAIDRLLRDDYDSYCVQDAVMQEQRDLRTVFDLYPAEHPADAPSVADELREARRIIQSLLPPQGLRTFAGQLARFMGEEPEPRITNAVAFLTRTSWVEQQETRP